MNMDIEIVISNIFVNKCIWDKRLNCYSNSHIVDKAWNDISTKMGVEEDVIKSKWMYLKDQFALELGKIHTARVSSGKKIQSKWPYFKSLMFLKGIIKGFPIGTSTVRPRNANARSAENIAAVRESVEQNPRQSLPHRSQELGLSQTTTWRILRDLGLHKPSRKKPSLHKPSLKARKSMRNLTNRKRNSNIPPRELEPKNEVAVNDGNGESDDTIAFPTNGNEETLCHEYPEILIDEDPEPCMNCQRKRKQTKSNTMYNEKNISIEEKTVNILERVLDKRLSEDSEDFHFFQSLLPHVENIPNHMKMRFRIQIQKLVEEFAYPQNSSQDFSPLSISEVYTSATAYNTTTNDNIPTSTDTPPTCITMKPDTDALIHL